MDRREFTKLTLGAGAVAAAGDVAMAQTQTTGAALSPSDALKLPPELRPIFEQSYPRFSEPEHGETETGEIAEGTE